MRRILAALVLALGVAGCSAFYQGAPVASGDGQNQQVRYVHDDAHHVSCWVTFQYGISCLPDSEVTR